MQQDEALLMVNTSQCTFYSINLLSSSSAYRLLLALIRHLYGADRNLVLSPGQRADQHYQELAPEGHPTNGN